MREDTNTDSKAPARAPSWRDVIKVHPAADLFPMMDGAEFDALVADIKANGLREEIVLFEGMILDGRNRYRACIAAHIDPGFRVAVQSPERASIARPLITDPYAYVLSANVHRRHLTPEQKLDLLDKVIKANPSISSRRIAKLIGASPTTASKRRRKLEATGDVSTVDTSTDTKGRMQPTRKKRRTVDDFIAERNRAPAINREMKLGADVIAKIKGTTLDNAREQDELIMLNRGAPPGEHTTIVEKLVADAAAGKPVSAIAETARIQKRLPPPSRAEIARLQALIKEKDQRIASLERELATKDQRIASLERASTTPIAAAANGKPPPDDGLDIPNDLRRRAPS